MSLEPVIAQAVVSPRDFSYLQHLTKDYYKSVEPKSKTQLSDDQFHTIVVAMEQYFENSLKTIANALW